MGKIQELYSKVAGSSALQETFNQIMADAEKDGTEAAEQKLVQFAQAEGYEISIEEMRAFFVGMATQASGELSDAELDQVAGGKSFNGAMAVTMSVLIVATCIVGSLVAELTEQRCAKDFK